jgi:aconitate hydratase
MNTFASRSTLRHAGRDYTCFRIDSLDAAGFATARLPYSIRILLENLLRREDGESVTAAMIRALAGWSPKAVAQREIAFMPSRVLLQDFTGVPAVVDLAAMRDAMAKLGGDPSRINPLLPAELVIDHSVQVDHQGSANAFDLNAALEFSRNRERYAFLRWGQAAFRNFAIVPPDTGIVHQINIEYLARVVFTAEEHGETLLYPDTLVGTDSHTTMANGLGVLGWGVGGIEAEAAMLGQPLSMLIPEVIGVRLSGKLAEGATATDLVLTLTAMLRKRGVVGKFVEYFGPGLESLPLADRATIANMAPEYGATCGIFPVDAETLRYLRLTGRTEEQIALVEAYYKAQGLFHTAETPEAVYTDVLALDLATVAPSIAGPKRPQDLVPLPQAAASFAGSLPSLLKPGARTAAGAKVPGTLQHGSIVLAAITSCTNTSNPSVMLAAGLLAQKATARGLRVPAHVKTSLAPGSKAVTKYLDAAGLTPALDALGFQLAGYGCTTCIGNSGPLPAEVSEAIARHDLVVCSVLSGNRNFEGRINPEIRANYLMSPPLVVAFALAGRMFDPGTEPLGCGSDGQPVYLREIWPTQQEIAEAGARSIAPEIFRASYATALEGDSRWQSLTSEASDTYAWDADSTYIQNPPYFEEMALEPAALQPITGARVLAWLGDSVTTDHISPAGSIKPSSPAGEYLSAHGIKSADFNSYGSRRGNHEVMMRGTFANTRLRNRLAPGTEGGVTRLQPSGEEMTIFAAAERYRTENTPVIVLAGKEYGTGSSRDWAAKGPKLLGVRAVIAESFERIHRSNLAGMGILPLQFLEGENAEALGLDGTESYAIEGIETAVENFHAGQKLCVVATRADGQAKSFAALLRLDTPQEARCYKNGGILPYVVRQLLKG